jgi:ribosomal protein S27E
MSDRFVSLKCETCGGKLSVYHDMERFACGYCGTEMVVQRRGGTVVLKAVTEAIKKVQVGTDKTAAELAIVRHEKELAALRKTQADLEQNQKGVAGFVCGGLLIALGFVLIPSDPSWGWWLVILGCGAGAYGFRESQKRDAKMEVLERAVQDTERKRAEKRRIADG